MSKRKSKPQWMFAIIRDPEKPGAVFMKCLNAGHAKGIVLKGEPAEGRSVSLQEALDCLVAGFQDKKATPVSQVLMAELAPAIASGEIRALPREVPEETEAQDRGVWTFQL